MMELEKKVIIGILVILYWIPLIWEVYITIDDIETIQRTTEIPNEIEQFYSQDTFIKSKSLQLSEVKCGVFLKFYNVVILTIVIMSRLALWGWQYSEQLVESFPISFIDKELYKSLAWGLLATTFFFVLKLPPTVTVPACIGEPIFPAYIILGYIWQIIAGLTGVTTLYYIGKYTGQYLFVIVAIILIVSSFSLIMFQDDIMAKASDLQPLEDQQLHDEIGKLASEVGFPMDRVFVQKTDNGPVNAYYTGFYGTKRIVVIDTLLKCFDLCDGVVSSVSKDCPPPHNDSYMSEEYPDSYQDWLMFMIMSSSVVQRKRATGCSLERRYNNDEVLAIICHELGHWNGNHGTYHIFLLGLNIVLVCFVCGILHYKGIIYRAFCFKDNQPIIIGAYLPICFVFDAYFQGIFMYSITMVTHQNEYAADQFSKKFGMEQHLINALIKIDVQYNIFPVRGYLYSLFLLDHPSVVERIHALQ